MKVLKFVEFAVGCKSENSDGGNILCFDSLPIRSVTSRRSEERVCCKLENCGEAGEDILCFCNLPSRLMTSQLSGV